MFNQDAQQQKISINLNILSKFIIFALFLCGFSTSSVAVVCFKTGKGAPGFFLGLLQGDTSVLKTVCYDYCDNKNNCYNCPAGTAFIQQTKKCYACARGYVLKERKCVWSGGCPNGYTCFANNLMCKNMQGMVVNIKDRNCEYTYEGSFYSAYADNCRTAFYGTGGYSFSAMRIGTDGKKCYVANSKDNKEFYSCSANTFSMFKNSNLRDKACPGGDQVIPEALIGISWSEGSYALIIDDQIQNSPRATRAMGCTNIISGKRVCTAINDSNCVQVDVYLDNGLIATQTIPNCNFNTQTALDIYNKFDRNFKVGAAPVVFKDTTNPINAVSCARAFDSPVFTYKAKRILSNGETCYIANGNNRYFSCKGIIVRIFTDPSLRDNDCMGQDQGLN